MPSAGWLADTELASGAREEMADPANLVAVSASAVWEACIKRALGKLACPDDLPGAIAESGFEELAINSRHAELAGSLPPHHRDPFDRMFIAQATIEQLVIVTRNPRFQMYEVETLPR